MRLAGTGWTSQVLTQPFLIDRSLPAGWPAGMCHTRDVASRSMSCVPITPEMACLLEACRSWPLSSEAFDQLQAMPEWDEAQAWGLIMQTGRLTGTGSRHTGDLPKGIVLDR